MPTAPGCHAQLCLTYGKHLAYIAAMDAMPDALSTAAVANPLPSDVRYFTLNNDQIAIIAFMLLLAIFALVVITVSDGDELRKRRSKDPDDDKGRWRSDHKL